MTTPDFTSFHFAPIIKYDGDWFIFDLRERYDPEFIAGKTWGIGRYNERRGKMYTAPQYKGERNIHMGIDFWTPPGVHVYAFYDGEIAYFHDHREAGNYGPTIVTKHRLNDHVLFVLHGHLTRNSIEGIRSDQVIGKGEKIGEIGTREVNGGWVPHLHLQLSFEDPGQADMPGVVTEADRDEALEKYPDPRLIVGRVYQG